MKTFKDVFAVLTKAERNESYCFSLRKSKCQKYELFKYQPLVFVTHIFWSTLYNQNRREPRVDLKFWRV